MSHLETRVLVVSSHNLILDGNSSLAMRDIAAAMLKYDLEGRTTPCGYSAVIEHKADGSRDKRLEPSMKIEVYNGGQLDRLWPWLKMAYNLTCAWMWTIYHPGHPVHPGGFTEPPHCIEGREECKRNHGLK